jgi:hypothetical protein
MCKLAQQPKLRPNQLEHLPRLSDLRTSATPDAFAITLEVSHPDTIIID